jgi:hypothetical protein
MRDVELKNRFGWVGASSKRRYGYLYHEHGHRWVEVQYAINPVVNQAKGGGWYLGKHPKDWRGLVLEEMMAVVRQLAEQHPNKTWRLMELRIGLERARNPALSRQVTHKIVHMRRLITYRHGKPVNTTPE